MDIKHSAVCLLMISVVHAVMAGLKANGTELNFEEDSFLKDMATLRGEGLSSMCKLKVVHGGNISEVSLSQQNVDILDNCPLEVLNLDNTSCFSAEFVDLSNMVSLQQLYLGHCRDAEFTITGLPESLQILDIRGLTVDNVQLDDADGRFGDSLEEMYVSQLSFCSSEIAVKIFGKNVAGVNCFLPMFLNVRSIGSYNHFKIGQRCTVTDFSVSGDHYFSLTSEDLALLQQCPLEELHLWDTSCFSSPRVDLSGFSRLEKLTLQVCKNTEFKITGLPVSLQTLDIHMAEAERQIQLDDNNGKFGESLRSLYVNDAPLCCPDSLIHMFGYDLPKTECLYVCYDCLSYLYHSGRPTSIKCGLSEEDTKLTVVTDKDTSVLRQHILEGKCRVDEMVVLLPTFALTQEDIDILSRCPLTDMYLMDSGCFSASVDLGLLLNLTHLRVEFCRNPHFVITGLPASLQVLDIPGVAEFNIRLVADPDLRGCDEDADGYDDCNGDDDDVFGRSLTELRLYSPAMCCDTIMYKMFSRNLSSVCYGTPVYSAAEVGCGLKISLSTMSVRFDLFVDSRQLLHDYIHQLLYEGIMGLALADNITEVHGDDFHAVGGDFYLTQEDIGMLEVFGFSSLILSYTSCFSGSVDLSSISNLRYLSIAYCTNLEFTITGLPPHLWTLDIRGLPVDNIRIEHSNKSIGPDFRELEVSKPTTCSCPQATVKMFGRRLSEHTTCGVTESIHSSLGSYFYSKAFKSEGLDSAISSCDNLIENSVLRILLWVIALFSTCGNLAVISYRLTWGRQNLDKSHSVFPFNLALSDLLMGIYLLIIIWADHQSRGQYVLFDEDWRLGPLCQLAGFLGTLSSEVSAIFILLVTLDRFLAIQFPFGQYRLNLKHTWILCGTTWLVGLLIASLPLIVSHWEVYSYNSICVGLPLNTDYYSGSDYAIDIFIVVNSVLFLLIAAGQVLIYRANWSNTRNISLDGQQAKLRYRRDMAIARQLSLIVITDFLCWFPICVMGLMAQTGSMISNSTYAWSAVVVMPVNSSINPTLMYTLKDLITAASEKFHSDKTEVSSRRCNSCSSKSKTDSTN